MPDIWQIHPQVFMNKPAHTYILTVGQKVGGIISIMTVPPMSMRKSSKFATLSIKKNTGMSFM